jgi:myo-inositol-1(or 4)-monophosphatase
MHVHDLATPYARELQVATTLITEVGSLALTMQASGLEEFFKTPTDIVTRADREADARIRARLKEQFPEDGLLTEENLPEGTERKRVWVVDPIDGTVNFARGLPLWGISIALLDNGVPVVAACFLPALSELYTAVRGLGAFLDGRRLAVSKTTVLRNALVSNGDFNVGPTGEEERINSQNLQAFAAETRAARRVKCFGSAVVEGCFVASGRLDIYRMEVSQPWDIAGIALLVEEAGGRVSDLAGHPVQWRAWQDAIFSNGRLHNEALMSFGRVV